MLSSDHIKCVLVDSILLTTPCVIFVLLYKRRKRAPQSSLTSLRLLTLIFINFSWRYSLLKLILQFSSSDYLYDKIIKILVKQIKNDNVLFQSEILTFSDWEIKSISYLTKYAYETVYLCYFIKTFLKARGLSLSRSLVFRDV